jgi:hypothetical protein
MVKPEYVEADDYNTWLKHFFIIAYPFGERA